MCYPEPLFVQLEFCQPILTEIQPGPIGGKGGINGKILRVRQYGKNYMSTTSLCYTMSIKRRMSISYFNEYMSLEGE